MKVRNALLSAAALSYCVIFAVQAQAAPVIYTNASAFTAANPGLTTYVFPASGGTLAVAPPTYTLNGVSFITPIGAYVGNDSGYGGTPYFDSGYPLHLMTANTILGLYLGSFSGAQTISYTVNGQGGTLALGANQALSFLGFNGNGVSLDVSFSNAFELDVLQFLTMVDRPTDNAVPEPATWAMLLAGLAGIGVATRRGKTTAATHYA